jgi:NADH dehydrogenase
VLPVFGGGHNKFQPVYVGDVADAVMAALNNPDTAGKTFELGGPATYNFRQLLQLMLQITGYNRLLIPVPMPLAYLQALILERLPTPLLTRDQLRLLKKDNVVADKALTLKDLGITPTALESILPSYLSAFKNPKDHRGAQLD